MFRWQVLFHRLRIVAAWRIFYCEWLSLVEMRRLGQVGRATMLISRLAGMWTMLQLQPRWRRWPIKCCVLLLTVFLTLYPDPRFLYRHIRHIRQADDLPNPADPAVPAVLHRLDAVVSQSGGDLLSTVESFVHEEVPYGWDWDVWGVVDYLPSVGEVIAEGREDCDGRAVLAAALLRARGIDARLVGDLRHMWVRTPMGDTMNPLGDPVFDVKDEEVVVRWGRLLDLGPLGYGIAVFPLLRETIILLTACLLVLPTRIRWPRALAGLSMMFVGLFVVRFAGQEPLDPWRWGIGLGLMLVLAGLIIGAFSCPSGPDNTDRSVCEPGDLS
jgi:hypothetical protein